MLRHEVHQLKPSTVDIELLSTAFRLIFSPYGEQAKQTVVSLNVAFFRLDLTLLVQLKAMGPAKYCRNYCSVMVPLASRAAAEEH